AAGATLTVTWQGCADAGFCYPPETKIVPLGKALARSSNDAHAGQPRLNPPLPLETRPALPVESPSDLPSPVADNHSADLPFSALWALLIGIGIAFTPCVLPMYPLISGIVL
ncbi:protein-disulfide reductase DsbD domain-containing protein, partial [Klebsiella pneumoniae]